MTFNFINVICFLTEYKKGASYTSVTMHIRDAAMTDFIHTPSCLITLQAKFRLSQVAHKCPVQLCEGCSSMKITEKKKAATTHISNRIAISLL